MKKATIYYYKGVFMKISEKDIKKIVKESVIRVLNETNKIRPWKGNSLQIDPDWGDVRKRNGELAAQFGEKAGKDDIAKKYGDIAPFGYEKKIINKYQDDVSKEAQRRAIEKTGSQYVGLDTFKHEPESIKKALGENGLEIGIHGKTFSFGNSKLPPSTMIINITSAFECPSQDNCSARDICYPKKTTKVGRLSPELRDLRNEHTFPYLTGREILKLLELYIELAPIKIHDIRISEAGDFRSQEEIDFCDKIAGHLKAKYGINTTVYTNAIKLDFSNVKNMIINASSPIIRGADRYFLWRPLGFMANIPATNKVEYRTLKNGDKEPFFRCCGDCYMCRFCYNTREQNGETGPVLTRVYVKQH